MIANFSCALVSYWPVAVAFMVCVTLLLLYRLHRTRTLVRLLAPANNHAGVLLHYSQTKYMLKTVLFWLGAVSLCLALLRPQTVGKPIEVSQEARDVFIALDISRSMLAQDCLPNRLACAKEKIKTLLSHLSCERVGLILFSGSAFVQCPLTKDYGAFYMFLDALDVETISSGSTVIDRAIRMALEQYAQAPARKNKLLVLVTDGEDFSTTTDGVKQQAQQERVHIFALGVGTLEGSPIPLFDTAGSLIGHQKDAKGAVVISKLNEPLLQSLTQESGGTYVRMTSDDQDTRTIASLVQQYEKEKFDDAAVTPAYEWYPLLALISFICFLLEWVL